MFTCITDISIWFMSFMGMVSYILYIRWNFISFPFLWNIQVIFHGSIFHCKCTLWYRAGTPKCHEPVVNLFNQSVKLRHRGIQLNVYKMTIFCRPKYGVIYSSGLEKSLMSPLCQIGDLSTRSLKHRMTWFAVLNPHTTSKWSPLATLILYLMPWFGIQCCKKVLAFGQEITTEPGYNQV